MLIGYARTSILDQRSGFEAQIEQLETDGYEGVFRE